MLRHEIPTHLDVQDKMLLGLTVRQSMHLMGGLATSLALWHQLALWQDGALAARAVATTACLLATAALVLVRPHRRGLDEWTLVAVRYAMMPRRCVWRAAGHPPYRPAQAADDRGAALNWCAFDERAVGTPAGRGAQLRDPGGAIGAASAKGASS